MKRLAAAISLALFASCGIPVGPELASRLESALEVKSGGKRFRVVISGDTILVTCPEGAKIEESVEQDLYPNYWGRVDEGKQGWFLFTTTIPSRCGAEDAKAELDRVRERLREAKRAAGQP